MRNRTGRISVCRTSVPARRWVSRAVARRAHIHSKNAKQSQFPRFWLRNEDTTEKQSQLGRSLGSKRRANVPVRLSLSCEDSRPTKTHTEIAKQSQFQRFWLRNEGVGKRQSQFDVLWAPWALLLRFFASPRPGGALSLGDSMNTILPCHNPEREQAYERIAS